MIPVCEPCITQHERRYLEDCLDSGWISSAGAYLERFESGVGELLGMGRGVAVANGSLALELACALLDLKPGDEVIMPSFTIISCANAVIRQGGVPVLVDSLPDTWQMDHTAVAARITPRTRAIMVVHIYGHPAEFDPIAALARQHGLTIIEDAAEAHGALYKGRQCGGLGDISCFSFYANKLITTGEGGMVLCRDPRLADRARSLRNLCFLPGKRFVHEEMGHNYRLTNMQAALGLGQLERLEEIVDAKRAIAARYDAALAAHDAFQTPMEMPWARSNYWVYGLVLRNGLPLDAAQWSARLAERGVETRPFFMGMHEQPVYRRMGLYNGLSLPVCERLYRRGLYIPSGLTLTADQQRQVIDAVLESLEDMRPMAAPVLTTAAALHA